MLLRFRCKQVRENLLSKEWLTARRCGAKAGDCRCPDGYRGHRSGLAAPQTSRTSSSMPVTLLDLIVIGVMLISALLAMVRGFTREVLSIAAWVAAAAAALLLFQHVQPFLEPYIKNPTVAQLAAGGAV